MSRNRPRSRRQLLSLLAEGVFHKFPELKVVLLESGFTWLPHLMWRTNKTWRGVRPEVPWIDRPPADVIREQVRVTLQPVDAPAGEPRHYCAPLEHIGTDRMLLFSTDYPHWHFDGDDVLPDGLSDETIRRLTIDNPLETYPRLRERGAIGDNASGKRGDGPMNIPVRADERRPSGSPSSTATSIRRFAPPRTCIPFLPERWREHMATFGEHLRNGLSGQLPFPRMTAAGMRVDAFPEQGPPGSDLALMRRQHLDANGVESAC